MLNKSPKWGFFPLQMAYMAYKWWLLTTYQMGWRPPRAANIIHNFKLHGPPALISSRPFRDVQTRPTNSVTLWCIIFGLAVQVALQQFQAKNSILCSQKKAEINPSSRTIHVIESSKWRFDTVNASPLVIFWIHPFSGQKWCQFQVTQGFLYLNKAVLGGREFPYIDLIHIVYILCGFLDN